MWHEAGEAPGFKGFSRVMSPVTNYGMTDDPKPL